MTGKSSNDADRLRVASQYRDIEDRISEACARAGRKREEVTLIGVTKTVEPSLINAALDAGLRHIGENRVQEYLSKKDALHLDGVQTHLIGHLQTNKVKSIVGKVDMIQSVDSLRLATQIEKASAALELVTPILVEVNIGGEESKSGVAAEETERLLTELSRFTHLSVQGLMTIPPISDSDAKKRHYFSKMRELFIDIRSKNIDNVSMHILSMGMSDDFEAAVSEGSTMVRVGTAIFGKRCYPV
ncbi:MAG: YggS family pyridoxal phosphate-dependent enzyme [Clostridia bacterium]|nr:YggS family pyridoxal phosphate-dependent enzyme [Clostridia bacterium]